MGDQRLQIGNKIEMSQLHTKALRSDENRVYVSQILDMQGEDIIVAAMPIYEEHLIPLEIGTKYDTYFHTKKGMMRGECEIVKRGKEGKIYVMELVLTSDLKKYQRRQYYRCSCSIDTLIASLTSIEALAASKNHEMPEDIDERAKSTMMVDISGGGIRVISKEQYEKSSYVCMKFPLIIGERCVDFTLLGRVVLSIQAENNRYYYDNRIQFKEIKAEQREDIIKYVFEQQRKLRKKERG